MSRHLPFKEVEARRPPFEADKEFHYTKTPNPSWKPGQGPNALPSPSTGAWKTFIPYSNISVPDTYQLLINSVVPRPVCLCSTLDADGKPNLAPFSYFGAVGHNPPIVMVAFAAGSKQKDTAVNIKSTKQFVANIISESFLEAANYTSIDAPAHVSEWALCGLTQEPSVVVKPHRVKQAYVSMECELEHVYEMYDPQDSSKHTQTMVLGRIKAWHVKEDVLVGGGPTIDLAKLKPISRLGGISYGRTISGLEIPRAKWEEEKERNEVKALAELD